MTMRENALCCNPYASTFDILAGGGENVKSDPNPNTRSRVVRDFAYEPKKIQKIVALKAIVRSQISDKKDAGKERNKSRC